MTVLLVALGAVPGAPLRYLIGRAVQSRHPSDFPWGTFTVNIIGSCLLGLLVGLPVGEGAMALMGIGFCGSLTTYSTFGYETLRLAREGKPSAATANLVVSTAAGLLAAACGLALGHAL